MALEGQGAGDQRSKSCCRQVARLPVWIYRLALIVGTCDEVSRQDGGQGGLHRAVLALAEGRLPGKKAPPSKDEMLARRLRVQLLM